MDDEKGAFLVYELCIQAIYFFICHNSNFISHNSSIMSDNIVRHDPMEALMSEMFSEEMADMWAYLKAASVNLNSVVINV